MQINQNHLLSGDSLIQMNCQKNKQKYGNGLPDTIVIHYTAGRSAESSANYLCKDDIKASAHLVIGRDGKIYQLVSFDTVAWHAGKSAYSGREWLNKYSIGIELDNAGPLEKVGDEYQAWFGTKYQANDVMLATHRNETNPAYWHAYTEKQIETCRMICELLIEKYGILSIVGHEEIAPQRKRDPGPAFPLDKFRDKLFHQNRTDEPDDINKKGIVTATELNIRSDAGGNFEKVAPPLTNGTAVKVLEEKNGWYKVETKITGWVGKAYVEIKE